VAYNKNDSPFVLSNSVAALEISITSGVNPRAEAVGRAVSRDLRNWLVIIAVTPGIANRYG